MVVCKPTNWVIRSNEHGYHTMVESAYGLLVDLRSCQVIQAKKAGFDHRMAKQNSATSRLDQEPEIEGSPLEETSKPIF